LDSGGLGLRGKRRQPESFSGGALPSRLITRLPVVRRLLLEEMERLPAAVAAVAAVAAEPPSSFAPGAHISQ